jgi:uncharacterized protein YggE
MRRLSPILVTALLTTFATSAALAEKQSRQARQSKPATITVSGTGTASYTPRKMRVAGNFKASDPSSASALSKVSAKTAAAKQALISLGVAPAQIRTEAPYARQEYDGNGRPKQSFVAVQSLTVKVPTKQFPLALAANDAIAGADGEVSSGPEFSARAYKGAEGRAAAAAVKDARSQAEREAGKLGLTLGRVISIGEQPQSRGGFGLERAMTASSRGGGAPTPTQFDKPEKQTVEGYRTVTFEAR